MDSPYSLQCDSVVSLLEPPTTVQCAKGNIVVADHGIVYMIIKESSDNKLILALCLKNEKFEEILFQGRRDLIMEQPNLFTVGGCLCLAKFCSPLINELANFEDWRMKKNGTLSYSWSKLFAITVPVPDDERVMTKFHVRPVSFMKDGGILFQRSRDELVVYNSKTQKFEQVKIAGLEVASPLIYRGLTYVETLISPNAM
ncbi:uncharacterized protein LOC132613453 [Lycium barbarum]|uniref:uncharacterized protein LOC132613453 n=1 Tax=Lycium barbarum TaxID=112863 RepID=UPI00293E871E|nr:uncharacterized protein LOC132613453 [Lycium barbarum]